MVMMTMATKGAHAGASILSGVSAPLQSFCCSLEEARGAKPDGRSKRKLSQEAMAAAEVEAEEGEEAESAPAPKQRKASRPAKAAKGKGGKEADVENQAINDRARRSGAPPAVAATPLQPLAPKGVPDSLAPQSTASKRKLFSSKALGSAHLEMMMQ